MHHTSFKSLGRRNHDMATCGETHRLLEQSYETKDVSYGVQTDRYMPSDELIIKVAASEQGLVSEDALDANTAILDAYDIPYPETEGMCCDLEEFGYSAETPVVIQEQADKVYSDVVGEDESSFLDGATAVLDKAAQHNVVLDPSITNFGSFDGEIRYLDVQDQHSVQENGDSAIKEMYTSLGASAALHGTISTEAAQGIVASSSQVYEKR